MLDDTLKDQLRHQFNALEHRIELVLSAEQSPRGEALHELLHEVATLSPMIEMVSVRHVRTPSFAIRRKGTAAGAERLRFCCLPTGRQFTSFVLAILYAGGVAPKLHGDHRTRIARLAHDHAFDVYISHDCFNCPESVQTLLILVAASPLIRLTVIDGGWSPHEVEERDVRVVPMVYRNGTHFGQGRIALDLLITALLNDKPS